MQITLLAKSLLLMADVVSISKRLFSAPNDSIYQLSNMQNKENNRDFISRSGTVMTVIAWLIFLAILFTGSDYLISKRNNPNQQVETEHIGLQKQVLLTRNAHGHYVSNGTINNHDVVFLLDTGASDIAIPESVANEIGLTRGYAITIKTANGNTTAYRTKINSAAIGDIILHDLNATILTNMHGEDILLGMSFLKHLELIQKGKTLTIRQ